MMNRRAEAEEGKSGHHYPEVGDDHRRIIDVVFAGINDVDGSGFDDRYVTPDDSCS